jgi:site-specific DNA recombinase
MNCIGYVRVSTSGQATDGVSMDAQRERIEAWAKGNGCTLDRVYVDAGLSGKRADNRPELQRALDATCKAKGVLVVYSLSRLARSTRDTLAIAERLDKAGADLVSLSERIDTTSAAGKMLFRLLAVLAEFERDLVAERTRAALAYKRANGERIGAIPFGFDLADDGTSLIHNPVEQRALRKIRDMRQRGATLQRIADVLTRAGVSTKTGRSQVWRHTAVRAILARAEDSAA